MPRKKYMQFAGPAGQRRQSEDLALLLDCSGSMAAADYPPSRLEAAIQAACALVEVKREQYPADRVAVVDFSRQGRVSHPLAEVGRSAHSLERALRDLSASTSTNITSALKCAETLLTGQSANGGSPSLLGHLKRFLTEPQAPAAPEPAGPRAGRALLLSDGGHNHSSKAQMFAVAERMKDTGIVIGAVGIGGSPSEIDEDDLKRLASGDPESGQPLYCFIGDGDTEALIREFKHQAHHIQRVKGN